MLGLDAGYYIPDRLLEGYSPSGEALVRLAREEARLLSDSSGLSRYDAADAPLFLVPRLASICARSS